MPPLFKCTECNKYTLEQKGCPYCGGQVTGPAPPRFSPQDKYGKYRREAKRKAKRLESD
ncbi:RNA-protein complex protein Nop10 [Candidatus Thorarchaeota archaeon]|nr:MAG: RNA-protein complex protein Nop10 [Candidatus Thorarchaeota archaeon]